MYFRENAFEMLFFWICFWRCFYWVVPKPGNDVFSESCWPIPVFTRLRTVFDLNSVWIAAFCVLTIRGLHGLVWESRVKRRVVDDDSQFEWHNLQIKMRTQKERWTQKAETRIEFKLNSTRAKWIWKQNKKIGYRRMLNGHRPVCIRGKCIFGLRKCISSECILQDCIQIHRLFARINRISILIGTYQKSTFFEYTI